MCPTLQPYRPSLPGSFCPWGSQARTLELSCHALLQEIFQTQRSNPHLLRLLHWQPGALHQHHLGIPNHYVFSLTHVLQQFDLILSFKHAKFISSLEASSFLFPNRLCRVDSCTVAVSIQMLYPLRKPSLSSYLKC